MEAFDGASCSQSEDVTSDLVTSDSVHQAARLGEGSLKPKPGIMTCGYLVVYGYLMISGFLWIRMDI